MLLTLPIIPIPTKLRMILDIICVIMHISVSGFWAMMNITDLVKGDRIRLVDFGQTDALYRRKLLSLGVTRGVELHVIRVAPLGCPLQVEVRGTSLTLRKEEACYLQLERI